MPAPKKTPALLRACIADYLDSGSLAESARRNGLSDGLLPRWRKGQDWIDAETDMVASIATESKATFNRTLKLALEHTEARLKAGDTQVLKGGVTVTTPVRARDAAVIVSILFDKLRLIEGKATKITSDQTKVQSLLDEFKAMGQAYRTGQVLDSTSTEVVQAEGRGSLEAGGEGQNQPQPMPRHPPSAATTKTGMPLLPPYQVLPRPAKGSVRRKIQESADDPG